jgi:hypothetical protein
MQRHLQELTALLQRHEAQQGGEQQGQP